MKFRIFRLIVFIFSSVNFCFAQVDSLNKLKPEQKKVTSQRLFSIGIGFGAMDYAMNATRASGFIFNGREKYVARYQRPTVTAEYSLRSRNRTSVGFALSYQQMGVRYKYNQRPQRDYIEKAERINHAIKIIITVAENGPGSFYMGPRVGATLWRLTTSDPKTRYPNGIWEILPSAHYFAGYRHFFGQLGIGGEIGIGFGPYFAQAHAVYRFSTQKKVKEPKPQSDKVTNPSLFLIGMGYSRMVDMVTIRKYGMPSMTTIINTGKLAGRKPINASSLSPAFTAEYNLRTENRIAAGLAASYQEMSFRSTDTIYSPVSYLPISSINSTSKYARINVGIKVLLTLARRSNGYWYCGPRVGYTIWQITSKSPYDPSTLYVPSLQLFAGYHHYFGRVVVGGELGIGTAPYIAQVSVGYKLKE